MKLSFGEEVQPRAASSFARRHGGHEVLYIIKSGGVEDHQEDRQGRVLVLSTLHASGEFLGEMSLIDDSKRSLATPRVSEREQPGGHHQEMLRRHAEGRPPHHQQAFDACRILKAHRQPPARDRQAFWKCFRPPFCALPSSHIFDRQPVAGPRFAGGQHRAELPVLSCAEGACPRRGQDLDGERPGGSAPPTKLATPRSMPGYRASYYFSVAELAPLDGHCAGGGAKLLKRAAEGPTRPRAFSAARGRCEARGGGRSKDASGPGLPARRP